MSKVYIPQDYHTPLSVYEMQRAIEFIKSNFQVNLSNALNLRRVSAPLFVDENSGLNDNLNGDILYWNEVLGHAFEISSMGIRVDPKSLDSQLTIAGCDDRRALPFHKMLLNGELPLTMGGGIGQSRLCMLLIGTAHIGEVQVSLWDEATRKTCEDAGVMLL